MKRDWDLIRKILLKLEEKADKHKFFLKMMCSMGFHQLLSITI